VAEPHKVTLVLGPGGAEVRLICPKNGCPPPVECPECGRLVNDLETGRCEWCPRPDDECWVRSWFDNLDGWEMYDGSVCDLTGRSLPLPISERFDLDSLRWRVAEEEPDAP
jgi:hypothetical protein